MGTRFVATHESIAHEKMKKAIVEAIDTDTLITGRRVGPVRMLKNRLAQQIIEWESSGFDGQELLKKIGRDRARDAIELGDIDDGSPMCGQIAGLIHDIPSSQEVIDRIIHGITEVKSRLDGILT
jgi:NAD(P)H-dependent flavin oxidoreductase YrpB (nitropropane dioxygenase family)